MGLDGDTDMTPVEVRRAAVLAYQLPADSRVKRAVAPEASHDITEQLLREIEHNQRLWHWANTDKAKNKETAPQEILLPGEAEARERAAERAAEDALDVADLMGLNI